jgi:hypothetical protein
MDFQHTSRPRPDSSSSFTNDNRGKLWSIDDDQKLMEAPHFPNTYFSQLMGRSENAIKFRRSHLAAKIHQNDPETPLQECVCLMGGDMDQAETILDQWAEKNASFTSFLDSSRKRKSPAQQQPPSAPPVPVEAGINFGGIFVNDDDTDTRIKTICKSIRDEGGNLASVFNDPHFLPSLIQYYPGFEAYARIVQARPAP